jgi:hypothetical protein
MYLPRAIARGVQGAADHYHIKSTSGYITIDDESKFGSLDKLIEVRICPFLSPLAHCVTFCYHSTTPRQLTVCPIVLRNLWSATAANCSGYVCALPFLASIPTLPPFSQVDQASMAEFEINPAAIVKGVKLGSGQFGGTCVPWVAADWGELMGTGCRCV